MVEAVLEKSAEKGEMRNLGKIPLWEHGGEESERVKVVFLAVIP